MTLSVAFDQFADTLNRLGLPKEVFLAEVHGKVIVSGLHAEKRFFVSAESPEAADKTEADLKQMGLTVLKGRWQEGAPDDASRINEAQYVAAVAYKAKNHQVGIWVDAFPFLPTQAQVLHAIYDEFKQHGEIGELGFEAFVRLANPTVVIISSSELTTFAMKHTSP